MRLGSMKNIFLIIASLIVVATIIIDNNVLLKAIVIILVFLIWRILTYVRIKEDKEKIKDTIIDRMNCYDEVTGILNRKYFTEKLEELMKENSKNNTMLALIFIDLDNFKVINDTYGHSTGDIVLREVSNNIKKILSKDCLFARFSGDEFLIALPGIKSEDEVKVFAEKLKRINQQLIVIDEKSIYSSASIGISLYPKDADNVEMLLRTSDMAMNKAKKYGKNGYDFFNVDMMSILKREVEIEKALRHALSSDELFMVFQPKVKLKGRNVEGFEALVRWNSKELGFVSPAEFIPVAENSGLIVEIGKHIMEESFKKCKDLLLETNRKFHVAINISDIQLRDNGFIDLVSKLLEKYEVPPEYIEFEITEGVIMESVGRNIDLLLKLKKLGVSIALDDFGTGYSSLSYLKRLPIDVLKIDKSFVDGIGIDEKSEHIAESIISLSHTLDLKVVAEGVETAEQLDYLVKLKCDSVQGYYFGKPEKFENVKDMI